VRRSCPVRAVDPALLKARTGTPPRSWHELLAAGDVSGIPVDPTGVAYELTPPGGAVAVSRRSRLFPLPEGGLLPGRPAR